MDLLCTRRVDPVRQSPRAEMYGYFTHGTVPPFRPYSLPSSLLPTAFAGCLPRPNSVAGHPVTRLSPRLWCRVGGGASGYPDAGPGPPLKPCMWFSRTRLSRSLMLPGCNRRYQLNKVYQPILTVELGLRQLSPTAITPSLASV